MAAARVYALVALPTASLECIAVALAPIYHVVPGAARAYTLATGPRLSVHSYWLWEWSRRNCATTYLLWEWSRRNCATT